MTDFEPSPGRDYQPGNRPSRLSNRSRLIIAIVAAMVAAAAVLVIVGKEPARPATLVAGSQFTSPPTASVPESVDRSSSPATSHPAKSPAPRPATPKTVSAKTTSAKTTPAKTAAAKTTAAKTTATNATARAKQPTIIPAPKVYSGHEVSLDLRPFDKALDSHDEKGFLSATSGQATTAMKLWYENMNVMGYRYGALNAVAEDGLVDGTYATGTADGHGNTTVTVLPAPTSTTTPF